MDPSDLREIMALPFRQGWTRILQLPGGVPQMEVTCPACAARYKADEQKLRGKTARMRCKACDAVWLVSGPAAVVKRGADREHRDLFASRPLDTGSVKQTLRPPPFDESPQSGTSARNETSVLFTVDALRGSARTNTQSPDAPPPSSDFIIGDDEGIIDLNALASTPPPVGSRSIAPLFSEPPPAAFAADVSDTGLGQAITMPGGFRLSKRVLAGIGVGGAALVLVLCSVGLSHAFKGEEPVARSAAAPLAPPPAVSTPEPAPPAPAAPANAVAASDDDAKAPATGGRRKAGGRVKSGGGARASFPTTKVQSGGVPISGTGVSKTVPKASDKCGCKGDFNCILRCTATGK